MVRAAQRQRSLKSWLLHALNNDVYPGLLFFKDKELKIFTIFWLHKSKQGWNDSNIAVFRDWAIFKGNAEGKDPRELKAAFRNALRSRKRFLREIKTEDKKFRYWQLFDPSETPRVPKSKSPKKRQPRQKKSVKQTTRRSRRGVKSAMVQEEPCTSGSRESPAHCYVREPSTSSRSSASSYRSEASTSGYSSAPIYISEPSTSGRSSAPSDIGEISIHSSRYLPPFENVFTPPRSPPPSPDDPFIELAERTEALHLPGLSGDPVEEVFCVNAIQLIPSPTHLQRASTDYSRIVNVSPNSELAQSLSESISSLYLISNPSEEQEVPEWDNWSPTNVCGFELPLQDNLFQKEKVTDAVFYQMQEDRASPIGSSQNFYETRMDFDVFVSPLQTNLTGNHEELDKNYLDAVEMAESGEPQILNIIENLRSDHNCSNF